MLVALAALACGGDESVPRRDEDLAVLRARNALVEGRPDRARLEFESDVARHPDRLESLRDAGYAWISGYQPSYFRGAELLERYLALRPADEAAALRLAETLLTLGEQERLAPQLDRLGSSSEAARLRAEAWYTVDPGRALEPAHRAVALEPEATRAHVTLARVLERLERRPEARHEFEAAIRLQPLHAPATYSAARLALAAGDRSRAAELFALHPLLSELLGEGTLAAPTGARALELIAAIRARGVPATADLALREARALSVAGRIAEAMALVTEASAAPDASYELRVQAAMLLGECGDRGGSRRLFERALAERPDDIAARSSLIRLALDDDRLDDAGRLVAEARNAEPGLARFLYFEGDLARRRGDEAGAAREIGRALELAPYMDGWRIALADLELAAGDRGAFRRVVGDAPEATPRLEEYRRRHAIELAGELGAPAGR